MSPLREFRSLSVRFEEDVEIEPFRRYYLIFEGANTERKYFQGIDNNRKELDCMHQKQRLVMAYVQIIFRKTNVSFIILQNNMQFS